MDIDVDTLAYDEIVAKVRTWTTSILLENQEREQEFQMRFIRSIREHEEASERLKLSSKRFREEADKQLAAVEQSVQRIISSIDRTGTAAAELKTLVETKFGPR